MTSSPLRLLRARASTFSAPTRAGMLVPWANTVIEHEMPQITGPEVRWHYARLVPASLSTALDETFMNGLVAAIPAAADQLSALALSAICFGCTSASATHRQASRTRPRASNQPVPLLSAFDAILDTLHGIGARSIVLLTPYPDNITSREAAELSAAGVTVSAWRGMGLTDGYDQINPDTVELALRNLITDAGGSRVDAAVISCTNLNTLSLLPRLEHEVGLPIVTSNIAMAFSVAHLGARTVSSNEAAEHAADETHALAPADHLPARAWRSGATR